MANAMVDVLPTQLTVGLVGTLGAGKTTFVQAIARAARVDVDEVTSPTFTLLQSHQGTVRLNHLDAYRVVDEDEFLELGVDELFEDQDAWTIIEWADRVSSVLPVSTLWMCFDLADQENTRNVVVFCNDESVQNGFDEITRRLA